MRQPKFAFGEKVTIPILFKSEIGDMFREFPVRGIICKISYDPECGTTGHPLYHYDIYVEQGNTVAYIRESEINKI